MSSNYLNRVLHIDLSKKIIEVEERSDLFESNLGGAGVAIKLLDEECPKGVDPLSPENPIVLAVGPLTAIYPCASKTVAMFKSPLTGNLGESHAGGRSAMAIRLAGYGAIVIKGASDLPLYLSIHGDAVKFKDASTLWGMKSSHTVGRVLREAERGSGVRTIIRIGGAGENLVRFACAVCETYRHFGRLGLGAVMGSKKLKAIVVSADKSFKIKDATSYRKVFDEVNKLVVESAAMKKYHDLGTAENVLPLNALGGLPYRNLNASKCDCAEALSGESLAEKYLARRVSCSRCPVGCIHLAALRELYEPGYYFKTTIIPYDYEPIYSLGSMLGLSSSEGLLKLTNEVDVVGLDAMSTGVALAWATEAFEKGLISKEHTGGLELRWGDHQTYIEAVRKIAETTTDFYRDLGRGVSYASKVYGGEDFALSFGGNEMPGYHTGLATYVNYLTSSRHSHLDSAGYSLDQKLVGKSFTAEQIVSELLTEEWWRQVLSSLVVCFFARKVYTPEIVARALATVNIARSQEELEKLGEEIYKDKTHFKLREGFNPSKYHVPKRIFEVETPHGLLREKDLRKAIDVFVGQLRKIGVNIPGS